MLHHYASTFFGLYKLFSSKPLRLVVFVVLGTFVRHGLLSTSRAGQTEPTRIKMFKVILNFAFSLMESLPNLNSANYFIYTKLSMIA